MIIAAFIAVLTGMSLILIRAIKGPGIFNRVLAANNFGTHVVVLIALIGEWQKTFFFLDIALVYALVNFITMIALLRYIQHQISEG